MAKGNGQGGLIPSVGYLRCSTDEQVDSTNDQKIAVQQYADTHGYKILRWYCDEGISGDDTDKRLHFQQMMADARDRHDFQCILVWNQDRFGRFTPQEASYWTWPLSKAGIQLVTVGKGPIDWADFTEWLTYSVNQHGKNKFLHDLSENVVRSQYAVAKAGGWIGGKPYGYELEGPKRARRLTPSDPQRQKIVKRIFTEFTEQGRSMTEIAKRLNADGFPSPRGRGGRGWQFDAVKSILENPAYVGDFVTQKATNGKYHTASATGTVIKATRKGRKPESEWMRHPNHHEALVDRETFAKARAILAKSKTGTRKQSTETNPYIFSGLLRCGRCGSVMYGLNSKLMHYECKQVKYGKCVGTTVKERDVLECLADHLENLLGPDVDYIDGASNYGILKESDLPAAFHEIRKLVTPRAMPKQDRKRLEKQRDDVKAKLTKARQNVVLLDAANIPAAQEQIRGMDEQLAALNAELAEWEQPTESDINSTARTVLGQLFGLAGLCRFMCKLPAERAWHRGSLYDNAPGRLKRFLSHVENIVVHTVMNGKTGHAKRHTFVGGEVTLQKVGIYKGSQNPRLPD